VTSSGVSTVYNGFIAGVRHLIYVEVMVSITQNWFSSFPIVIMVYIGSGTKFLPVIASKVPPAMLPELGEMPEMYTS
jgi:ABC-type transport system involved in multi-copper enzyme maturation permease subunit